MRDALIIGTVQSIALIPGVSRSGATISAGLLLGIDRVTATRLSFFLAVPALVAAGALQLPEALDSGVGLGPVIIGSVVSFLVAYASIAWLLKFVAGHSIAKFVPYRVVLGVVVYFSFTTGRLWFADYDPYVTLFGLHWLFGAETAGLRIALLRNDPNT